MVWVSSPKKFGGETLVNCVLGEPNIAEMDARADEKVPLVDLSSYLSLQVNPLLSFTNILIFKLTKCNQLLIKNIIWSRIESSFKRCVVM